MLARWMSRDSLFESGGLNLLVTCGNNLIDRHDVNGQFDPFSFGYEVLQFGLGAYAGLTVRNWFNDVKNKYKCCCKGKVVGLDEYDGVLDGTMTSWTIAHRVTGCKLKQLGVDFEHVLLLNLGHEMMELLGFRPSLESEFISFLNKTGGNLGQALREYLGDTAKDVLAVLEGYFSDGKDCESKYIPKECVHKGGT